MSDSLPKINSITSSLETLKLISFRATPTNPAPHKGISKMKVLEIKCFFPSKIKINILNSNHNQITLISFQTPIPSKNPLSPFSQMTSLLKRKDC